MIKICDKKRYYSSGEVARLFGVSVGTIIRWIKDGKIVAYKTLGGRSRIGRDEVNKLVDEFVGGSKNE